MAASLVRVSLRGSAVCVALSGGIDSVVLLHALRRHATPFALRLEAMHVNHGLSPNARAWESFCRSLCTRLRVPLTVRRVKVARKGRGVEAGAREARYAALAATKAGVVALAHQMDDQAETVLFNILRGSGLSGASGMAECGPLHGARDPAIRAWRPLLGVSREHIEAYARKHTLDWVEDESNADETLARNWVRHSVAPLLASRFPRWRESLSRAASHFAEAQALLATEPQTLTVEALRVVSTARAKLLLRGFLHANGLRAPGALRIREMLRQFISAPGDAHVEVRHDGKLIRCYRGRMSIVAATPDVGEVAFKPCLGKGIDAAMLRSQPVSVRTRQGGERMRLAANRPSRTLKNLFQEAGVPPWERDHLPLLFCGPDLVWVPGLGVAAAYQAAKGTPGLRPEWKRVKT